MREYGWPVRRVSGDPSCFTQCNAWGEGRWIGRESPSLPLHVCFTKGAINSCSWFLGFPGTPHPTPGIRHFFKKHCSKSFCFIHIPSQRALIEHLLRVRNHALQQIPYLCVGPGEGRMESFLSKQTMHVGLIAYRTLSGWTFDSVIWS